MKSYKELVKEFENKVKILQKNCKHKKSIRHKEYWVKGYPKGHGIRVCCFCDKLFANKEEKI